MNVSWSKEVYRVTASFGAPLAFVFQWLTDFGPKDAAISGGGFRRRVIERSPRRVVFEDLSSSTAGWVWLRNVVTLRPPDQWHLEAIGNGLDARADYKLTALTPSRTRLSMTYRMRPGLLGSPVPPRATLETMMQGVWNTYRDALERDFRASRLR